MPTLFGKNIFIVLPIIILSFYLLRINTSILFIYLFYLVLILIVYYLKNLGYDYNDSASLIKILSSSTVLILGYNFFKNSNLKKEFILNGVLVIFSIINVISILNFIFFNGIYLETNDLGDPINFAYDATENKYSRDGLFGANIISYSIASIILFLLFTDIKLKLNKIFQVIFIISSIFSLLLFKSRYVLIFLSICFLAKYAKKIFYLLPFIVLVFIFLNFIDLQILETLRFSEGFGRFEKINSYLKLLSSNYENILIGVPDQILSNYSSVNNITLSDNSFLEILSWGGIMVFIYTFYLYSYFIYLKNPRNNFNVILFLFVLSGFFITTSIYFVNYIFIIVLLTSLNHKSL